MRRGRRARKLDAVEEAKPTEYLTECLWPGVSTADLADLDARVRATAGGEVRYLGSMLMPGDEVVFCFFESPSAEAVEIVAGRAGIPFERILESVRVSGRTESEET